MRTYGDPSLQDAQGWLNDVTQKRLEDIVEFDSQFNRINKQDVRSVTASLTLGTRGEVVLVDATAGLVEITLPSLTDAVKETFHIVKTDNSSNIVRIIGTINGQTNADIGVKDTSLALYATTTDWRIV